MQKPQLVIMAAGLGSRFGGLKQMAPVDAQNHWIIDSSIFDAVRAGFGKITLIVKPNSSLTFAAYLMSISACRSKESVSNICEPVWLWNPSS